MRRKKEEEKKESTGLKFEVVNGAIVMLPPDPLAEDLLEKEEVVIDQKGGAITVLTESTYFEEEVQHVYDEKTAQQSQLLAEKVRAENQERSEKARYDIKITMVGDTVIADGETYKDLNADLSGSK